MYIHQKIVYMHTHVTCAHKPACYWGQDEWRNDSESTGLELAKSWQNSQNVHAHAGIGVNLIPHDSEIQLKGITSQRQKIAV
jgi:hypothetical protein